jgi:hypothetical protein
MGLLLILFATMEMFPNKMRVKNLILGGVLSSVFGGLSGNHGAIRSAFLINTHLGKEAFIGTNAFISTVVDIFRIGVTARVLVSSWFLLTKLFCGRQLVGFFKNDPAEEGHDDLHSTDRYCVL